MKIEEAIVYLLATSRHGMKTEQIARELELRNLVPRRADRLIIPKTPDTRFFHLLYDENSIISGFFVYS